MNWTIEVIDTFHDHLDTCPQCRTQPFDLCEVGRVLLDAARTLIQVDQLLGVHDE